VQALQLQPLQLQGKHVSSTVLSGAPALCNSAIKHMHLQASALTGVICVLLCYVLQNQIRKVRDRVTQLESMGVPEDALDGHAFHTYTLTSPDDSVQFVFKHNVQGRSMYAQGTVDAVLFLAQKMREGAEQKVYSMADVAMADIHAATLQ
jgi:hypothetical protein